MAFPALRLAIVLMCTIGVSSHGWVTSPVSKNEMAYHHYQWGMGELTDFHYEPQSSNKGNGLGNLGQGHGFSCGANNVSYTEGLGLWQSWYDAAGVPVPRIKPGQDLEVNVTLTIDHGGQAWLMLACADAITEGANWTILERSKTDRAAHFMPSSPGAFAWAPLEYESKYGDRMRTVWTVPEDFSCPQGHGVARWVWKTAVSCNDFNNIGRKSEPFTKKEYSAVVHAYKPNAYVDDPCKSPPETFISCMDFVMGDVPPTPPSPPGPPAPPTPTPPPATCAAVWQQCAGSNMPSTCCQGTCQCTGTAKYSQCKPSKGQWNCGT